MKNIVNEFLRMGFSADDFKPGICVYEFYPLDVIWESKIYDFESAQKVEGDVIILKASVGNPISNSHCWIRNLRSQFIRNYSNGRGEVILCTQWHHASQGNLPTKQEIVRTILEELAAIEFTGTGEDERKIIVDRSGQIQQGGNSLGIAIDLSTAYHIAGNHFVLLLEDERATGEELQDDQFFRVTLYLNDSSNTDLSGLNYVKAEILDDDMNVVARIVYTQRSIRQIATIKEELVAKVLP